MKNKVELVPSMKDGLERNLPVKDSREQCLYLISQHKIKYKH